MNERWLSLQCVCYEISALNCSFSQFYNQSMKIFLGFIVNCSNLILRHVYIVGDPFG